MHHNKSMYITNVEKEGPFLKLWGQSDKKSSLEVEEALLRASERFEEGKYTLAPSCLEVGTLCCAKYIDEKYYRARITSIALLTDGLVEVNFQDYGNKDVVPIVNLRSVECFNPSFISLPPLSTPFILAECVCIGGEWNDAVIETISKEIRYIETNYVIVAQAIRYYLIKVFVRDIDLGLHIVRRNLMQSTSIQTQEAVLLAMMPRRPIQTPPPNQALLQYKSFTLEPHSQHEVYVSYITDGPCHFSVQMKKYESALAQLMRELNSIPLKPLDELPIPGTVCLAKCLEDGHICRAVVTSEVDSQYKLFYVDFGNTELVPPENLFQMAFKFIIPKIMAIRLSLANIEKPTMTLDMKCAFKQFVDNRLLMMEVLPGLKKMALPKCRLWDPDTNTDVIEVLNRAAKCAYPDPVALHKGFTQLVKVSFVYSCNRFYVQLKSKEPELSQLMVNLQTYCNSNQTSYLDSSAKVGQPCCALFSFDQQWYRSLITEVNGNNAKVRYIDYGNEEDIPLGTLKVIEGEYLTILRPQAIECCLNGYQNMAEDQERDNKLEELILELDFTMKVIDTINNKTLVDLMDSSSTTITALLLEAIIAQTKIQAAKAAAPVVENSFNSHGRQRESPGEDRFGEDRRKDGRYQKSYFQHDDRGSPRNQNEDEGFNNSNDNAESWRQDNRGFKNRGDLNSNENGESWRQDNRGFKNRKENDWSSERPPRDNFRKDKGFRGRNDNDNDRPQKFRNQNEESGGTEDTWGQKKPAWQDRKKPDENADWGGNDNNKGSFKPRNKPENDWNNKNSTGGGDWGERRGFRDRNNTNDGDWGSSNKGTSERKFGDRNWENRDNDRGGFKKKPFRREGSEISSSGSEKSFGKGLRTSSRNDNRPPRTDRKFGNKSSDNSWNVSAVQSVIDSAPANAKFKEIDVTGRQERVLISWFHNPGSFFCQLVDSQESFKSLMQDIQEAYKGRPAGSCVKGAPAIGLFPEDNVLYRARIMEVIGSQYKIHYVDFGNVSIVDKVWPIEKKFMDLPMQSIACGFSGIEPVGDSWPNPDNFSKYFEKESLNCNFISNENGRYLVSLSADNEDISQQLVNDALAEYSGSAVTVDFEMALLVGQQFRAMIKSVTSLSDFTVLLQSGITLNCSMHNLANATETFEDVLKQRLDKIVIVYADALVEDRFEVTLYNSIGDKLNIVVPDEGAFDTVEVLCPYLVTKSTFPAYVTHVNETSVVLQPNECIANACELNEQMFEFYDMLGTEDMLAPEEGFVYAAMAEDRNWYRGRVTDYDDDGATVMFLEFGNSEKVDFHKLKELRSDFFTWEVMSILVNVTVPTADLLEKEVIATIHYGESGWEGELQIVQPPAKADTTTQPPAQLETLTETAVAPSCVSTESSVPQSGESSEMPTIQQESSSGIEEDQPGPIVGMIVVLSHMVDPRHFYLQRADFLSAIDDLQAKLQEKVEEMATLENPAVGDLCAAPFSDDGQWYRSRVLDVNEDAITVCFIDYGNTDIVDRKTTQIKTLPDDLLSVEEYALRCSLKIKPAETECPETTIKRFEELTSVENITMEFIFQDGETSYVELYSNGENVRDLLVQENLAENEVFTVDVGGTSAIVSHIEHPRHFYVQLSDSLGAIDELQLKLQEKVAEMTVLVNAAVGSLCAAPYSEDQQWYRSRILEDNDNTTTVRFVDYGNTDVIDKKSTQCKTLPDDLQSINEYSIRCGLKIKVPETEYPEATVKRFEELTSAENITIEFLDKDGDTNRVELFSNGENVKDVLIRENLAENEVESSIASAVVLSHIDSPRHFYIQLVDSLAAIDELQLKLQESVGEMALLETASVGGLCAAPYSVDQQWYRSQILDADDDITTVRFIDYGNTDVIDNKTTQIKTLPSDLLSLEEYATRCSLKIKPTEEDWPEAATERFTQLTSVENVRVEFIDQDEKSNYVELYSDGENVKDILIKENLAILDDVVMEGKLTGFVSHMNSPSEFWVQLESCCAELEWIAEQLSSAASFPDLEDLTPGSLCAAMFPDDEMWYRARILSNTVAGLEVLFLDYGNSCVCTSLKQLPEHLVMASPLAQKCSLQKPPGILNWSAESALKFTELSADGQTIFTVKKVTTGETSIVELFVNGEDVALQLLPSTDNGYVTDIESMESFSLSKEGVTSEEKYKLEKVPGADYNEKSLEKFVEINNEGKTCYDVEYLSENTVRLYLDGNDIRNELIDLLSPLLKDKSPQTLSVIATIEVIEDKSAESVTHKEVQDHANTNSDRRGPENIPIESTNPELNSVGTSNDPKLEVHETAVVECVNNEGSPSESACPGPNQACLKDIQVEEDEVSANLSQEMSTPSVVQETPVQDNRETHNSIDTSIEPQLVVNEPSVEECENSVSEEGLIESFDPNSSHLSSIDNQVLESEISVDASNEHQLEVPEKPIEEYINNVSEESYMESECTKPGQTSENETKVKQISLDTSNEPLLEVHETSVDEYINGKSEECINDVLKESPIESVCPEPIQGSNIKILVQQEVHETTTEESKNNVYEESPIEYVCTKSSQASDIQIAEAEISVDNSDEHQLKVPKHSVEDCFNNLAETSTIETICPKPSQEIDFDTQVPEADISVNISRKIPQSQDISSETSSMQLVHPLVANIVNDAYSKASSNSVVEMVVNPDDGDLANSITDSEMIYVDPTSSMANPKPASENLNVVAESICLEVEQTESVSLNEPQEQNQHAERLGIEGSMELQTNTIDENSGIQEAHSLIQNFESDQSKIPDHHTSDVAADTAITENDSKIQYETKKTQTISESLFNESSCDITTSVDLHTVAAPLKMAETVDSDLHQENLLNEDSSQIELKSNNMTTKMDEPTHMNNDVREVTDAIKAPALSSESEKVQKVSDISLETNNVSQVEDDEVCKVGDEKKRKSVNLLTLKSEVKENDDSQIEPKITDDFQTEEKISNGADTEFVVNVNNKIADSNKTEVNNQIHEETEKLCDGSKPCDISQESFSVTHKELSIDDISVKVEFQETILTSFSAPTVPKSSQAKKLSPTKIIPKPHLDSQEMYGN